MVWNHAAAFNDKFTAGEEVSDTLFKKYELGKLIGVGAFAKVYHGRNLFTGQSVAIKAISKQRILKSKMGAQVMREILIMNKLNHPNIVRLLEVLATKTKIYFVVEFAKGGELLSKISKGRRFSEDLSRKYFRQLVSAVWYCHSRGIYHRDLKPENLLLDENWELKVTDFGLSAVTDQIRSDGLLHTLCGTPAYVAPEILAKQGYDGAKIDVWSCGVILFLLNVGYLPFNDTNLISMYRKICRGEFRCPRWTSPELKRFLSRLLDPNPSTRITIHEILTDSWFQKGYNDQTLPAGSELEFEESRRESRFLNAFDLISLSGRNDLSDMFVSAESPEMILARIEELAKEEGMRVVKKTTMAQFAGQTGGRTVNVEVNRLTEKLVIVDVISRGGSEEDDIWNLRFKPKLNDLIQFSNHKHSYSS